MRPRRGKTAPGATMRKPFGPPSHRLSNRIDMAHSDDFRKAALEYHRLPRPGKIKVSPTTSLITQRDLSLAYSPGVAYACEAIVENPATASDYTARANLVAVITNGTAVLGLGDIGPL